MTGPIVGLPFATDGSAAHRRASHPAPQVLVVGLGSRWRSDDGVGLEVERSVARRGTGQVFPACRVLGPLADPLDLLLHWGGAELVVVADATRSGLTPGKVSRIELEQPGRARPREHVSTGPRRGNCPSEAAGGHGPSSTHGLGLAEVLRLGRALGSAPVRTVVIGVEGQNFSQGSHLSPAVAAAVGEAAAAVIAEVREALACA